MKELQDQIRKEVEDVQTFFVDWFNGIAPVEDLDVFLVPRFKDDMRHISPSGTMLSGNDIITMFRNLHGSNPRFKIAITDVEVRHDLGEQVLLTYTEWQKGFGDIETQKNSRTSTLLITKSAPYKWLHVHETLLEELAGELGPFDT